MAHRHFLLVARASPLSPPLHSCLLAHLQALVVSQYPLRKGWVRPQPRLHSLSPLKCPKIRYLRLHLLLHPSLNLMKGKDIQMHHAERGKYESLF